MPNIPDDINQTPRNEPPPCGPNCPAAPMLMTMDRNIARILRIIEGDGGEERIGLIRRLDRVERALAPDVDKRLDRLEQSAQARKSWALLSGSALAAVIAERAWAMLTGHR